MSNKTQHHDAILLAEIIESDSTYTLSQFCEICQVKRALVLRYIEYNVIDLSDEEEPVFTQDHIDRLGKGVRMQRDLELNDAGVALALDLLETIDQLKLELIRFRVHR